MQSQGICHRDLKLENLLLDGNGNLKVADFGLSTIYRKDGKKRPLNTRCGTIAYMAPEVILAKEYDGDFVDLWAAGIILAAMFCGSKLTEASLSV
jgi:serine/threonine protein kinase